MKKTYMIPALTVVDIKPAHILAGSINDTSGAEGLTKGEDWEEGTAGARNGRFSRWEDDWE